MSAQSTKDVITAVEKSSTLATPGKTVFADTVVGTIAGVAAREVEGVFKLGKGALQDAVARVRGTHETTQGVSVEVGSREVAVDLEIVVLYGFDLHKVASEVRALVAHRINQMTGLAAKEVNVMIEDIQYDQSPEPPRRRVE